MTRYRATLAYDGTAYQGFQRQRPPAPTIQAAVETAISAIARRSVAIVAAGRTDAGVHALGQVIAFDVDWKHGEDELLRAINAKLPPDIALQTLIQQDGFHPRYDALWRQYAYRVVTPRARQPLLSRYAWQLVGEELDLQRMNEAAAICLGEHDFAAFGRPPQAGSANTVRRIFRSRWVLQAGGLGVTTIYRIRGTAFLYHMVRRLAGLLVQVGRGKVAIREFEAILQSGDITRAKALAPARGLMLEAVGYPSRQAAETSMQELAAIGAARALEG